MMYYAENIEQYSNGCFSRRFRWRLSGIIPENDTAQNGYIVQHIKRKTCDSSSLYIGLDNAYNHEYWEAWPVKKGMIALPDFGYHDNWTLLPMGWEGLCRYQRIVALLTAFRERYLSSGSTKMRGDVYWATYNSSLWEIVENTFNEKIDWANDLQSARCVDLPSDALFIGTKDFRIDWDLSTEDLFINSIMCYLSQHGEDVNKERVIRDVFSDFALKNDIIRSQRDVEEAIMKDLEKHKETSLDEKIEQMKVRHECR